MRVLLDPDPAGAGGVTVETPHVEAPAAPPVAPPIDKATLAELAALKSRNRELEAKELARKEVEQKDADEKRRKAGEFDAMLKEREEQIKTERQKATEAEGRSQTYARDRELALALSTHNLRDGAADDLMELWGKEFEAEAVGGTWRVKSNDGRSVADVINERLKSARYAGFVKPDARAGGGGQSGGTAAPNQTKSTAPVEGTYEHFMAKARESTVPPNGHPLGNGTSRFGLKYKAG